MKKLQGAVIMIGSLFWEDSSNCIELKNPKELATIRKNWRVNQLDVEKGKLISLPIRYGRKSSSRYFTYTMTFSNSVEENGKGYYIPYKNKIDIKENCDQLYCQALQLARVEGISKKEENKLAKKWGSVGLKLNSKLKLEYPKLAQNIEDNWSQYFRNIDISLYRIDDKEECSISKRGILNFEFEEEIDGIDYFLATPVSPNLKSYPNATEIANAMNNTKEQYYSYFLENYKNGIRTKNDSQVIELLPKKIQDSL